MDLKVTLDPVDEKELNRYLRKIQRRLGNTRPIMIYAIGVISKSAQANIRAHGRSPYPWPALKESTIERRKKKGTWPGWPLVEYGTLQQSLLPGNRYSYKQVTNRSAEFGTKLVKARPLNFGVPPNLAARPFLYWRDEDIKNITSFAAAFVYDEKSARALLNAIPG